MPPEGLKPHLIILSPPPQTQSNSLESSFPIVTISIIGILATAILLMSYYAFVSKCCLNWHQSNTINHLYRHRRRREDIFALQYSVMLDVHGLDESTIQAIPTFRYRRDEVQSSPSECAVCLNEFKEGERVRLLPNCLHIFHIDCVDAWLQTHANCPLCRSEITTTEPIVTNSVAEGNPDQSSAEMERIGSAVEDDEAHVSDEDGDGGGHERFAELRNGKKKAFVCCMGDECIDSRSRGGEFGVQPIRRSFSMGSSNNRQLYVAVQEMLQKNRNFDMVISGGEESSSGSPARVRRSFFSFGHSRSSKNAVLPIQNEL